MTTDLSQFRRINWNNTEFRVSSRTATEIVITAADVSMEGEEPNSIKLVFSRPSQEWASLWDTPTNQWVDHPDPLNPIGNKIEEAAAKQNGKLKFSFGGHHRLGWSRWGFTAEEVQINR